MSTDPYTPPNPQPDTPPLPNIDCPACGSVMKSGTVTGSIDWLSPDSSKLDRFLGGKKILGPPAFSITIKNHRSPAFLCEACGAILVQPKR
jgi:ribosomal protein S27E